MTPQEQLCEKMRVEQSAYCLWLTAQPPEEILHHAYEYSVREDIILATEEMNLTPAQVRALLKSPVPLADVYKDFSKLETDYMSLVAQCVEDRADDLLKKEQQQNPPKVYRQSVTYAREHEMCIRDSPGSSKPPRAAGRNCRTHRGRSYRRTQPLCGTGYGGRRTAFGRRIFSYLPKIIA